MENSESLQRKAGGCSFLSLILAFADLVWVLSSSRSEYVDQLVSDIASYYGYNDFLAEKLFKLFSVAEVGNLSLLVLYLLTKLFDTRL